MDSDMDGVGDNSDADPNDPNIRIPADIEINELINRTCMYSLVYSKTASATVCS